MATYPFVLSIDELSVPVHLGVTEDERRYATTVSVWVKLFYSFPPDAVRQDDAEYLDYDHICHALLSCAGSQSFQLLEFLTSALYAEIRGLAPDGVGVWIRVHKPLPLSLVGYEVKGASAVITDMTHLVEGAA